MEYNVSVFLNSVRDNNFTFFEQIPWKEISKYFEKRTFA